MSKTFPGADGSDLPVLDHVTLTLHESEVVALLGRSGSGKSTLLRMIAGLIRPSSGQVRYRGRRLTGANPGVGMVFQSFALMPWLTVQASVELGQQARGIPRPSGAPARWRPSTPSAWTASRPPTPRNCPAGCASASGSPAPWSCNPTPC